MPGLSQQSAGVRFREIDLSQVIRSRQSSRGAILFVSAKGRPGRYLVNDSGMFKSEYGLPNAAVSFGHYCALAALNEMSNLECVRVLGSGYKYAAALIKDNGTGTTQISGVTGGVVNPKTPEWDDLVTGAEVALLLVTPKQGPGSYANRIAVDIRSQNLATPTVPVGTPSTSGGTLAAGSHAYSVSAIGENGETLASTVVSVTTTGSTGRVSLALVPVVGARGYYVYGRVAGTQRRMATLGATTLTFVDDGSITPDPAFTPITNPANLPAPLRNFTIRVFDLDVSTSNPVEIWESTLTDFTDGNGVQLEAAQNITAFSDYIDVATNVPNLLTAPPAIINAAQQALTDGTSGTAPTNGQISNAWEEYFGDPEQSQVNILINAGYTDIGVQMRMLRVAEMRGDAFAILDTPSNKQGPQDAITFRQLELNANTSYGALYTSDVFVDDPDNGKRLYTPPSGWVASIFARTDRVAGPQFQPAGLNRGLADVLKLRQEYNDAQRTNLFNAQVNYFRRFAGEGTAMFEASTLQAKASALSWISVRRMLNVIKPSVADFLRYSLHEPNDDFTRRQIVSATSDYLEYWKNARGILDYQVISDESNNPPAKYNLGILTVTIFITPTIPVHEIQVDIVITKAGMSWSEINLSNLG